MVVSGIRHYVFWKKNAHNFDILRNDDRHSGFDYYPIIIFWSQSLLVFVGRKQISHLLSLRHCFAAIFTVEEQIQIAFQAAKSTILCRVG